MTAAPPAGRGRGTAGVPSLLSARPSARRAACFPACLWPGGLSPLSPTPAPLSLRCRRHGQRAERGGREPPRRSERLRSVPHLPPGAAGGAGWPTVCPNTEKAWLPAPTRSPEPARSPSALIFKRRPCGWSVPGLGTRAEIWLPAHG